MVREMNMKYAALLVGIFLGIGLPAQAAPSTRDGEISVAQVAELIQRSSSDNAARNAAMAYLAGVGETTGLLIAEAERRTPGSITCTAPLGISSDTAFAALSRMDRGKWGQTAATPILVNDMLSRAGYRWTHRHSNERLPR